MDKISILIVDDDQSTRKSLSLIFKRKGYQVETAGTGKEALKKVKGKFFNLALLDIKLPDLDGVELLAMIKEIHPDIAVIMVTAYASVETAIQALNQGASFYITKPLNMDEVLSTIKEVQEKQRLVLENRLLLQKIQQEFDQRQQLEEQIRQSQKMEAVGRLAGGMAHDFNNLLTVITGNCQLMMVDLDENDPLYKLAEQIETACSRAESLTRQLLAISRKQVLQPKVLNINQVVAKMEKMFKRLIREDIELVMVPDPKIGHIWADRGQVEQVFLNLVVNAKDAMPKGGKLTFLTKNIRLRESLNWEDMMIPPGAYIMVSVSDTGIGMDQATQTHMFEPFFTTKKEGEGTGLGLSTVYGIVKQSGGYIDVHSEPGRGTAFKLYFPVTDAAVEDSKDIKDPRDSLKGNETILVVEDEDVVRNLVCHVLRMHGYNVLEAPHGGSALLKCEGYAQTIHMILTDVFMPELSGRGLVERLKAYHLEMKVLYMSGYVDDTMFRHGLLEEGSHFIQKPFSPSDLLKKIRNILDAHDN